jgi:hypothetical protein
MFYATPVEEPELAVEPDDDIVIVAPGNTKKPDDQSKPSWESVDNDNSAKEELDDEEENEEESKAPVAAATSSGRSVRVPRKHVKMGVLMADIEWIDVADAHMQVEIADAAVKRSRMGTRVESG